MAADAAPLRFVRTAFAIVPADDATAAWFDRFDQGEEIALCEVGETSKLHRFAFATFADVARRHDAFTCPEDVLSSVKAAIGHGHRFTTPDGASVFRELPTPKRPRQFAAFWRDARDAMIRLGWIEADQFRNPEGNVA